MEGTHPRLPLLFRGSATIIQLDLKPHRQFKFLQRQTQQKRPPPSTLHTNPHKRRYIDSLQVTSFQMKGFIQEDQSVVEWIAIYFWIKVEVDVTIQSQDFAVDYGSQDDGCDVAQHHFIVDDEECEEEERYGCRRGDECIPYHVEFVDVGMEGGRWDRSLLMIDGRRSIDGMNE